MKNNFVLILSFLSFFGTISSELTKVLVASGNGFLSSVEVINIDKSRPNSTCQNLPDLPVGLAGATGQLFQGKTPIICGGYRSEKSIDSCDCYALQNGTWDSMAGLALCRRYAASTLVTNQLEEQVLVISGGEEDGFGSRSSIETFDGTNWNLDDFASLPEPVWLHCLIQLNDSFLFSIGGYHEGYIDSTFLYNLKLKTWTSGPSLNIARYGHSCGQINWLNPATGEPEPVVVVAGGYNGQLLSSSELLFVNSVESGFQMGPVIPRPVSLSQMIQFENGVVVVGGGYGSDGYKLYQLNSPVDEWETLPQMIIEKRRAHVSFLIPDELTNCS